MPKSLLARTPVNTSSGCRVFIIMCMTSYSIDESLLALERLHIYYRFFNDFPTPLNIYFLTGIELTSCQLALIQLALNWSRIDDRHSLDSLHNNNCMCMYGNITLLFKGTIGNWVVVIVLGVLVPPEPSPPFFSHSHPPLLFFPCHTLHHPHSSCTDWLRFFHVHVDS